MARVLTEDLIEKINKKSTLKLVTALGKDGIPHSAYKSSLHVNEDGDLEFYDILESSKINENLVYSIWFEKKVTINILTEDKESFEIVGKPKKSVTAGAAFEAVYKTLKKERKSDLNAIWTIEPEVVREQTLAVRVKEQKEKYPILQHLDQLLKEE